MKTCFDINVDFQEECKYATQEPIIRIADLANFQFYRKVNITI